MNLHPPMDLRALIFRNHPNIIFVIATGISSFFALRLPPSTVPILVTLTLLLVYSRILFHQRHRLRNSIALIAAIAAGGTLARLSPSLDALSTSAVSVLVLFTLSTITSILTISVVYIDTRLCTRLGSAWSQITLFPALWVTLWCAVAYVSPIGRLSAWSSAEGGGLYGWMVPFLGPAGNDWGVAAWAVVFSQAIGKWYMGGGEEEEEDQPLIIQNAHANTQPRALSVSKSTLLLVFFLVTLSLPSFFLRDFPLPALSPETTQFSVGCILPPFHRYKRHSLTLEDYIAESKKFTSSAKILLWPEGAVVFTSEAERDAGFAQVQAAITGSYVGVSFEEVFRPNDGSGRSSARRTGIAIVSRSSSSPHLIYYKRHLVPVAESFSLRHSTEPPRIYTLELTHPNGIPKTEWAPAPNYTRPIPLSASICLDFSDPFPFGGLDSRPALILGPAKTWDISIGFSMWQQARQRANELGSMVLWCDGGDGGVSGVAGGGFRDFNQVGSGSWVKTIGVQYPFSDRRTPYAFLGHYTILLFWAIALGASLLDHVNLLHEGSFDVQRGIRRLRAILGRDSVQRRNAVPEGNLLD